MNTALAEGDAKQVSPYLRPSALKTEMGGRLRAARMAAGLEQAPAAARLGYSAAVHLSDAEHGRRFLPHEKLSQVAPLYGVSLDYLFGLHDNPAPDPMRAVQEAVAGRIAAEVHHLAATMTETTAKLVRSYLPSGAQAQRLAGLVLEAHEALRRLRARCPEFDKDIPASALVSRLDLAAEVAAAYVDDVRRARNLQAVRDSHAALRVLTAPLTLPVLPEVA